MSTRFDHFRLMPVLGAACLGLMTWTAPAHAASSGVDDELLAMQHEAELQNGEKLNIGLHRKPSEYRVCIQPMAGDIRLRVMHDGEVTEVLDGTCETITARHISVMADSKLPPGDDLVLKFKRVRAA